MCVSQYGNYRKYIHYIRMHLKSCTYMYMYMYKLYIFSLIITSFYGTKHGKSVGRERQRMSATMSDIVSYSLNHAIEEAVRECGGRDRVWDTRIHTQKQPQYPQICIGGEVGVHLHLHTHTHTHTHTLLCWLETLDMQRQYVNIYQRAFARVFQCTRPTHMHWCGNERERSLLC